jgi:hypothetical protein
MAGFLDIAIRDVDMRVINAANLSAMERREHPQEEFQQSSNRGGDRCTDSQHREGCQQGHADSTTNRSEHVPDSSVRLTRPGNVNHARNRSTFQNQ